MLEKKRCWNCRRCRAGLTCILNTSIADILGTSAVPGPVASSASSISSLSACFGGRSSREQVLHAEVRPGEIYCGPSYIDRMKDAPKPVRVCNSGHELVGTRADTNFKCDACSLRIPTRRMMAYCEGCDFSACWMCHTQNPELVRIAEMYEPPAPRKTIARATTGTSCSSIKRWRDLRRG